MSPVEHMRAQRNTAQRSTAQHSTQLVTAKGRRRSPRQSLARALETPCMTSCTTPAGTTLHSTALVVHMKTNVKASKGRDSPRQPLYEPYKRLVQPPAGQLLAQHGKAQRL